MIIDSHVHIFPDEIAEKALCKLSKASNIKPFTDGTFADTKNKMKKWGIDRAVFQNIATSPKQQMKINNTATIINNEENFYSFGSVHPDSDDVLNEIVRIKSLGLKGIKLHPDYQSFFIDEKKLFPIYDLAQDLGIPIIFHAGIDVGIKPPVHATPDKFLTIIESFPKLKIIAAHFGGFNCWDMVEYFLIGKNIYLDTSMTFGYLETSRMKDMILKHGVNKILFASDCPWACPANAVEKILEMKLSSSDNEKIFSENVLEILS